MAPLFVNGPANEGMEPAGSVMGRAAPEAGMRQPRAPDSEGIKRPADAAGIRLHAIEAVRLGYRPERWRPSGESALR